MAFVPNPVPPSFARVVRPATIRATRRSRPWLRLFLIGVLALAVGVLVLVWPIAQVTIVPVVEQYEVAGEVRVDLDAREPIAASGVVPVQVLGKGDTFTTMLKGPRTVRLAGSIVTYSAGQAEAVVAYTVNSELGQDYVVREPIPEPRWGEPIPGRSGRQVSIPFDVTVERYRRLPHAAWRTQLVGRTIDEAETWLMAQPGVAAATVRLYPDFFANFSQKIPSGQNRTTFMLDIAGKTSILE